MVINEGKERIMSHSSEGKYGIFVKKYLNWTTASVEPFHSVVAEFLELGDFLERKVLDVGLWGILFQCAILKKLQ